MTMSNLIQDIKLPSLLIILVLEQLNMTYGQFGTFYNNASNQNIFLYNAFIINVFIRIQKNDSTKSFSIIKITKKDI